VAPKVGVSVKWARWSVKKVVCRLAITQSPPTLSLLLNGLRNEMSLALRESVAAARH
jgi:hypothetical protein